MCLTNFIVNFIIMIFLNLEVEGKKGYRIPDFSLKEKLIHSIIGKLNAIFILHRC